MNQLEKLKKDAHECVSRMSQFCIEMDWKDKSLYADWLAQSYLYVRHATRVLASAAARCSMEQEPLHKKLLDGINEEKNHELLATRDLAHLKYNLKDFNEYPETSAYYQTLYYNIQADGPFALLGYFLPLEGLAAEGLNSVCDTIMSQYSEKGSSFMKVHCKLDLGHFEEGLNFLDTLSSDQLTIIERNMKLSTELYINMLRKIKMSNQSNSKARKTA